MKKFNEKLDYYLHHKPYVFGLFLSLLSILVYVLFQLIKSDFIDKEGTLYFSIGILIISIPMAYFYRWVVQNSDN